MLKNQIDRLEADLANRKDSHANLTGELRAALGMLESEGVIDDERIKSFLERTEELEK